MQRVFSFEIAMATKDRPKVFQLVTLALLAFSLTIILVSSFVRFSAEERNKQAYQYKASKAAHHPTLVSVRANQLLQVQK